MVGMRRGLLSGNLRRADSALATLGLAGMMTLAGCGTIREATPEATGPVPPPEAVARPPDLPAIGKWMFDARHRPAHWLGELFRGKQLREPINIILVDAVARTAEEAKARLVKSCARAGYSIREGHSAGYVGFIDGIAHPQLPEGGAAAFSNEPFEVGNNHGRFFGPHAFGDGWVFIGAFSREGVDPVAHVKHRYESFNRARDDLAGKLEESTDYRIRDYVDLDNALIGDPACTTGDHDGIAVLLTASRP